MFFVGHAVNTSRNSPTIVKSTMEKVPSIKFKKKFSAKLRKIRWLIYEKHQKEKNVNRLLDHYKKMVGEFLLKFSVSLKPHEKDIWKEKVKKTALDVKSPPNKKRMVGQFASNVISTTSNRECLCSVSKHMDRLDGIVVKLEEMLHLLCKGNENINGEASKDVMNKNIEEVMLETRKVSIELDRDRALDSVETENDEIDGNDKNVAAYHCEVSEVKVVPSLIQPVLHPPLPEVDQEVSEVLQPAAMDETDFNAKLHVVNVAARKVRDVKKRFLANNITSIHVPDYRSRLKEVRDMLDVYDDAVADLIVDLNVDNGEDKTRIENLEAEQAALLQEVLKETVRLPRVHEQAN